MAFKRLLPYAILFLSLQTLLRISLLGRALFDIELNFSDIAFIMVKGLWFDIVTGSFLLLPAMLYYLLLPKKIHSSTFDARIDLSLRFIFSYILLFDIIAEHLFWTEFTTRFNFIAVDYLVYTQEVIGNIVESYPIGWLLVGIGILAVLITWISYHFHSGAHLNTPHSLKFRTLSFSAMILACFGLYTISHIEQAELKHNAEASEIAANGIYNLFYAFWHNEIHYDRFYAMESEKKMQKNAKLLLEEEEKNIKFVNDNGKDLTRIVISKEAENHKNVILVVMESMSAEYMQAFGNKDNLTPNLDQLSKEGLFFTNLYATGTRTVRGLEAVTLSIPPTPGQSIIRRPHNENLFSLGFIFKDRGYDTNFIYGGYGYFDNMNNFFAGNGFDILDRTTMQKKEINFANVWGVCDEDTFSQALKKADESYANKKPFMHLIMTTSNHRPYTYPDNKIDIPSHSGRFGGVKYADYSIGKLISEAKTKPWFNDTIFIFIADHTAGAGGKAELDPPKYHIPLILYAPDFIKPSRFENLASQIDLPPILLGLLNFSYYTKFYGEDLLNDDDEIPHAFISNYQKIGLIKEDILTVLAPNREIEQYHWPDVTNEEKITKSLIYDTITYYQSASFWKERYQRIPTVIHKN